MRRSARRSRCLEVFEKHNQEVRETVPADRLLVFRVQDGWAPLCDFLGCEVPAGVPFPHLNEGRETLKKLARERLFGPWIRGGKIAAPIGVILGILWWLTR
ncbi:MAG: sulfotransferase [Planctomycetota bacterium]